MISRAPQLSIIIPTRNRRVLLQATLATLAEQTVDPATFEVIVVADGPTDDTPAELAALAATTNWDGRLHPLVQSWAGAAAARNRGLAAARGRWVLFLDDDVQAAPGLIAAHIARHTGGPPAGQVVLGHIVPQSLAGALHQQLTLWWTDHYRRLADGARWNALYTGNVSVPAEAARRAGGFDAAIAYGEDVAFGYALHEQGLPFVYAPEAVVSTRNPKDAAALLRDFSGLAAGSLALYRSHPGSLPGLPLAAYGATNLRMRLVRGGLLRVSRLPGAAHLIDIAFRIWAAGAGWGRLDRPLFELARGYYYWRGVRAAATRREWSRLAQWGVPILLYHSVSPRVPGSPDRYSVTPRRFALHLRVLRLLGYRIVPLEHLLAGWDAGLLPPRRVAAITFDDGYRDNRTHAWPILRQAGAASTVFVVSGHVGGSNAWDADNPVPGRRLVTWEELRGMDRAGFRAEAHSVSHPDLNTLEPAQLDSEIAGCRRNLEQQLNRAVTMFAYPYGHHSPVVRDRVAAAGYRHAFTVQPGLNTPATPPLAHPRLDIHGSDGLLHFMLHLWTGDDPLQYVPQLLHRGTARVIRRVLRAPEGSQ